MLTWGAVCDSRFPDSMASSGSTLGRDFAMAVRPSHSSTNSKLGTLFANALAMRASVLLICLLYVTGCDETSPSGPTVPLNERFTLAPGEVAKITGADLRLEFIRVSGDSRCPADAVCIQGGDAIVQIRATGGSSPEQLGLHTGDSSQASAVYDSARIMLVELQPYPFSSRTIAPDEYRATLTVTQ